MIITHRQTLTWFVLLACSIIYNFYLVKSPVNIYDEGIILAGADRILKGHVPYADFWSMYPPGQFYTLALLFKLFGSSILFERAYDIVIRSLLSISVFLIIKKIGLPYAIAIIGWVIALVYIGYFEFSVYPIYTAILLIILGAYFFAHHIETNQEYYLIISGFLLAVSFVFRHDLAAMAALSILLTLLVKKVLNKEAGLRSTYYFIFGISAVALPLIIFMAITIGVHPLFEQLIVSPPDIMPKYRWLPYPTHFSFTTIQFYVYPFALGAGFLASWFLITRLRIHSILSYGIFLTSLIGILFLNQTRVRSDEIHLLPAILLCSIVGPSLFYVMLNSTLKTRYSLSIRVAAYLFLAIIFIPLIHPITKKFESLNHNYFTLPESLYRSGYASVSKDIQELIMFVQDNTGEDEAIYVGVTNHDQFIINDVIVYFLANRRYATRYHELHPGVTTTSKIQKEIIQDLKNATVRVIVLAPRYWFEQNETRFDMKIDIIDDYIRENYKMSRKFGLYEVWTQKS